MMAPIVSLSLGIAFGQTIKAYYNPNCGCCSSYFSKLEKEGFKIERVQVDYTELDRIKDKFGVPLELRSCHTMEYQGRFIEGHVKPEGIRKVIKDKGIKGVASKHGMESAKGNFEDRYYSVRKEK